MKHIESNTRPKKLTASTETDWLVPTKNVSYRPVSTCTCLFCQAKTPQMHKCWSHHLVAHKDVHHYFLPRTNLLHRESPPSKANAITGMCKPNSSPPSKANVISNLKFFGITGMCKPNSLIETMFQVSSTARNWPLRKTRSITSIRQLSRVHDNDNNDMQAWNGS